MPRRLTALGGLPVRAAAATAGRAGRSMLRERVPRTSRDELMDLLKRKAWQMRDLEKHPVCLGVPLGQDGGPSQGVTVDLGLKTMATISLTDLVEASPKLKETLYERALSTPGDSAPVKMDDLLRKPSTVPMSVAGSTRP